VQTLRGDDSDHVFEWRGGSRRKNKKIHFFTKVRNAHSACLLPGGKVAVASSFGGDEVKIFGREKSGENIEPLMKVPLYGAHGVGRLMPSGGLMTASSTSRRLTLR
jgi:hypothetical protein